MGKPDVTLLSTPLSCDFSLIDDRSQTHPAWPAFMVAMAGKAYGRGPLRSAWHFFSEGYDARASESK